MGSKILIHTKDMSKPLQYYDANSRGKKLFFERRKDGTKVKSVNKMKKYDYLIVGSGLFGATYAYKATQAGKRCLVIDKRPQAGGNVYCEKVEGINVHKYGAHIFHTSNKEVWDFVNSLVPFNRYTNSPIANYKGELYNLPFNMNTFAQMWGVITPDEAMARIEEQRAEAIAELRLKENNTENNKINQKNLEKNTELSDTCSISTETASQSACMQASRQPDNLFRSIDSVAQTLSDNSSKKMQKKSENGEYIPRNLEEQALLLVGRDIYEKLIKEYTEKQWGRKCTELPAFIIRRLPLRFVFDNNYFNDLYQGIPIGGYNALIEKLLEGSEVKTNCDFFKEYKDSWREIADTLVYTGQLDEYFDYRLGRLDWRTVSFKTRVEDMPNYQGNAVINYTSHDQPYTRVIEHKHFEMFGQSVYECPKTVVSEEYSTEYKPGMEPYYPVNDERNNALAEQYRELAAKEENVIFGGRLAEYKYYDMAPVIEAVLRIGKW